MLSWPFWVAFWRCSSWLQALPGELEGRPPGWPPGSWPLMKDGPPRWLPCHPAAPVTSRLAGCCDLERRTHPATEERPSVLKKPAEAGESSTFESKSTAGEGPKQTKLSCFPSIVLLLCIFFFLVSGEQMVSIKPCRQTTYSQPSHPKSLSSARSCLERSILQQPSV